MSILPDLGIICKSFLKKPRLMADKAAAGVQCTPASHGFFRIIVRAVGNVTLRASNARPYGAIELGEDMQNDLISRTENSVG